MLPSNAWFDRPNTKSAIEFRLDRVETVCAFGNVTCATAQQHARQPLGLKIEAGPEAPFDRLLGIG
jgi:hypothetical protein